MGAPKYSIVLGNLALLPAAILIAGVVVFAGFHGSFALAEPAAANLDWEQELKDYKIPVDAQRIGPIPTAEPYIVTFVYYPAGVEKDSSNRVGRDTFFKDSLVKRELFRKEKKHGLQKEWYADGIVKSEELYRDGVRVGSSKFYRENGALCGEAIFSNGSGIVQIFDGHGVLTKEEVFVDNLRNGQRMEVSDIDGSRSVNWYKRGVLVGGSYVYDHEGRLNLFGRFDEAGRLSGPFITLEADGSLVKARWFVHGREVTEEEYATATKNDSSLFPYFADKSRYRESVDQSSVSLVEKYRRMQPVRIPLEKGKDGNWIER